MVCMLIAYTDFIANFLNDSMGNISHIYAQVWVKEAKIKDSCTGNHLQLFDLRLYRWQQTANVPTNQLQN